MKFYHILSKFLLTFPTFYIAIIFSPIIKSQPNPQSITKNSTTSEVAYHLGYYDLFNRLRAEIDEKLNKMQDQSEIIAENFEAKGQFENADLVENKAEEKYNDFNSYFDNLFDVIDTHVVLQGEALDQTNSNIDAKIKLIKDAIEQLQKTIVPSQKILNQNN